MKSSKFIPCLALMQLVVGLSLLGIYESYKATYINSNPRLQSIDNQSTEDASDDQNSTQTVSLFLRPISTPIDWLFYLATFNNVFCLFFCLAGVLHASKEVILVFFIFNALEVVLTFHLFVDVWTDARIRSWSQGDLKGLEKSAIAFMFFNFLLALAGTFLAVRALQEIRAKQKEEYHRLSVISDNLQFEPDRD